MAIVGAGPSGVSVLERLGANAAELLGGRPLEVHLVDPYRPGPGRIWRYEQSPLLMLNTMASHVTMFTDESVVCAGPVRSGPSLYAWAREGRGTPDDPEVRHELENLSETSFPTRRLQSHYLSWVFEQAVAGLPPGTGLHHHRDRAVDLREHGAYQRVVLAGGGHVDADAVVLAVGHQDVELSGEQAATAVYAGRHGLCFVPPGYTADQDLSVLRSGAPVIVRGLGLAFVDLVVLLTEGRGGRYTEDGAGGLRYLPSGEEPVIHAGSRRGVPFPPKATYTPASPPRPPRFFDSERILRESPERLDFFRDVWPHAAREIEWGYYRELFTAHPERVRGGPEEFAEACAAVPWGGPEHRDLLRRTVVHPGDLFDIPRLDRPLAGETFPDRPALQRRIRGHVREVVERRSDPRHSAELGAVHGVLAVFGQLPALLESGRFSARSRAVDVDGWWAGFFNYLASGPPPRRMRELLALSEAGVLRFVGPDMWVRAAGGRFEAGSPALPGSTVTASALVEARLPVGASPGSRDPLVRSLYGRGQLLEDTSEDDRFRHRTGLAAVDARDGAVLDAAGRRHPRRFALGPFTTAVAGGNFTRPGTNPVSSRLTDAVARSVLLAAVSGR
ncbi:adenylate cyclase [Streptomyces carminius]|uniref:Adenylate cyclase n=1 Tax=Streptomyces carminius TaxID=2665496 RepID=A0A2M8M1X3_9ACTN|nr:adenylate cyclase [Streptomyces carminius]